MNSGSLLRRIVLDRDAVTVLILVYRRSREFGVCCVAEDPFLDLWCRLTTADGPGSVWRAFAVLRGYNLIHATEVPEAVPGPFPILEYATPTSTGLLVAHAVWQILEAPLSGLPGRVP